MNIPINQIRTASLKILFLLTIISTTLGCQATKPSIQQIHDDTSAQRLQLRGETYRQLLITQFQPDFEDVQLGDIIPQIQAATQMDFVTKWDVSGFGDGMDPESQITLKFSTPAPVLVVLNELMLQATSDETTWNLGPGYIRFGLKDTLVISPEVYVTVYPIPWLLDHAPMFRDLPADQKRHLQKHFAAQEQSSTGLDTPSSEAVGRLDIDDPIAEEMIDIITSIIDPLQWEKNGGEGGSIRYLAGTLIINAADFLHRQIGAYAYGASLAR